ncbi:TPA: sugar phosphate isomerase/epimerase [Candidatus Poribacteria bacterium]|nr:sugar phosphate isomerase/epimerase [Candidatus Poribacteria bacterium]HEX29256.1 sugar phosphate isomerase/epimerase [Candidatus Poribacteria bacterium]
MDEKKIGVIHYNFPGYSFEDFLRYASETGFGYVELSIADVWKPDVSDLKAEAEKVRQIVERYGLKVSALSAGNDFVLLDEDEIAKQVERMRKICEVARTLGTKVIRTEGGRPKDSVPQERWDEAIAGCLKRCLDFAEELDVYFALDNHGLVTNDAELQVRIFESVGSKRVGSNLDTMNYRWFGHDLKTINHFYEIIAPYVLHTHMKDGTGSRGEYRGAALGEGEIDLHYAVKCLKEAGYDGVWCAEYEGREDPAIGYRKCYQWLVENV